jgi:hypothetical protein
MLACSNRASNMAAFVSFEVLQRSRGAVGGVMRGSSLMYVWRCLVVNL